MNCFSLFLPFKTIRFLLIKNTAKLCVALQYLTWLRGFCPLIRGKQTIVCKGFAVSGEEGICLPCCGTRNFCSLLLSKFRPLPPLRLTSSHTGCVSAHRPTPSSRRPWKLISIAKKKNTNRLVDVFFLVAGVGISSCFLQSNLRTSPTYALQKSSVTAKTVGVYRFLTLLQIPSLFLSIKQKTDRVLPIRSLFGCGEGI